MDDSVSMMSTFARFLAFFFTLTCSSLNAFAQPVDSVYYDIVGDVVAPPDYSVRDVFVRDGFAYILVRNTEGGSPRGKLFAVDAALSQSDPAPTESLALTSDDPTALNLVEGYGMVSYQNYLYVYGPKARAMAVLNIETPGAPVFVKTVLNNFPQLKNPVNFATIHGPYLIVCEPHHVEVFSLESPLFPVSLTDTPVLLDALNPDPEGEQAMAAVVINNFLYVSTIDFSGPLPAPEVSYSGIYAFDFSDPSNLDIDSGFAFTTSAPISQLRSINNFLIAAGPVSLTIYRLENPTRFLEHETINLGSGRQISGPGAFLRLHSASALAQDGQNLLVNGKVYTPQNKRLDEVSSFRTLQGTHLFYGIYGTHVADINGDHLIFYPQEEGMLILKRRPMAPEGNSKSVFFTTDENASGLRLGVDENTVEPLPIVYGSAPKHLIADVQQGKLYWLEERSANIHRSDMDGLNKELVLRQNTTEPLSFALDTLGDRIYFFERTEGSSPQGKIRWADLDGSVKTNAQRKKKRPSKATTL